MANLHNVTLGRISFTSPSELNYSSGGDGRTYDLSGTIAPQASDNELDLAQAKYIRDELMAMAAYDIVYPFTYSNSDGTVTVGDSTMKGYVKVTNADVSIARFGGAGITYAVSLQWLGNPGEIRFESQFSGALLSNDHSITSTDSQFFCPPGGAYSIEHADIGTGSPPTIESRTASYDSSTTALKYISGSTVRASNPEFEVNPDDYYKGAVKVYTNSKLRSGLYSTNDNVMSSYIENGLVKLQMTDSNTQSRFEVSLWENDAWRSTKTFKVAKGTSETEWDGWKTVQIIKNYPECATLRFTANSETDGTGRLTFDVTLRRGARFFSFIINSYGTADRITLERTSAEACTAGTGYIVATSNDSDGNKFVLGSPNTHSTDTTNGGIYLSATQMKAFLGYALDGSSATGQNTADNIRDAYLDFVYEHVRTIKT
tara:strand:- start:1112 stop:2401 length:1290 start_codon:yes stop_codon:yes gene_type:complete